ncbi:MAG: DUF1015 domain-containing protein [Ruminococcaceae bacterium]|nr:DUF1015 domain-containing protein [Oscillospiraceae bacterium]
MKTTVFSAADILLPPYSPCDPRWESYGVIACDQFTSEPEYWEKVASLAKDNLSCYGLVLPEAYLGTSLEEKHKALVSENLKSVEEKLTKHENCLIYIERTLPNGAVRRGLVGKIDLEAYDFSPDSKSFVRATEETVVSRIPPRVAVRKEAPVELPHVMVFANDSEELLIKPLAKRKDEMTLLYSFTLMQGGGSICGYKIDGNLLVEVCKAVAAYEAAGTNGLVYAMGDGNHSLASAKAHFEDIKAAEGEAAMSHPARYALVEIVNLYDDSIVFEPIYRLLSNCCAEDFIKYVESRAGESASSHVVTMLTGEYGVEITIPALHSLAVGSLQILIDDYLALHKEVDCDYIHGTDSLRKLAQKEKNVGFLCDGIEKNALFDYVSECGNLPRKTFSMGEAVSKRYYIEARKIIK